MRRFALASTLFLLGQVALAAPPSAESVESLLTITKAESTFDWTYAQIEQNMRQTTRPLAAGKPESVERDRVRADVFKQLIVLIRDELSWKKLKPAYIRIYQDTFSQEEVDGMLAFYRSPVGVSTADKMPIVLQKSSEATQALIPGLLEKMNAMIEKSGVEAKAK